MWELRLTWDLFAPLHFADIVVLGHKCSDVGCDAVAPWLCHWPGRVRPKCDAHRVRWERVASAMGFELVSTALTVRAYPEPSAMEQRFAAMEME